MHIVHVIPSMAKRTGGPAFVAASLCSTLVQSGLHIELVTTDIGTAADATDIILLDPKHDMPTVDERVVMHIAPVRWLPQWAFAPSLPSLLDKAARGADLIHIHSINLYPQFAAWRATKRLSIPYIVSPHGALDPFLRRRNVVRKRINDAVWQERMIQTASVIHFTTEEEMRFAESFVQVDQRIVLPIGIAVEDFSNSVSSNDFRRQRLDGFKGPLVLNHGRISRKKGLDILVASMAELRKLVPSVRLALVGPDDENLGTSLLRQAEGLGIGGSVTLIGSLQGPSLVEAIADSDVWALPSHTENFGMAVAEAMAAGKPVVTSPHVNIAPEASEAGSLVMVENDPVLIAAEISKLLEDQELRRQIGDRAREYVKRFDWTQLGPQYIAMYNDAIEYHQHRGGYRRDSQ